MILLPGAARLAAAGSSRLLARAELDHMRGSCGAELLNACKRADAPLMGTDPVERLGHVPVYAFKSSLYMTCVDGTSSACLNRDDPGVTGVKRPCR